MHEESECVCVHTHILSPSVLMAASPLRTAPKRVFIDLVSNDSEKDTVSYADPEEPPRKVARHDVPVWQHPDLVPYPHQRLVVDWMRQRTEHYGVRGGVINADMGLGKCIIILMYIWLHLMATPPRGAAQRWPALVVCPKIVMLAWEENLARCIAPAALRGRVLFLHPKRIGSAALSRLGAADMRGYALVVTTYDMVRGSFNKQKEALLDECTEMDGRQTIVHTRPPLAAPQWWARGKALLHGVPWSMVCFDESQKVINPRGIGYKACMTLSAQERWSTTGTMLRNYRSDYWAQLRLLGYTGVTTAKAWNARSHMYWERHQLERVVYTLTYETAGVVLPPQHQIEVWVDLVPRERLNYEAVEQQLDDVYRQAMNRVLAYAEVLAVLGRMRLVCVSPALMNVRAVKAATAEDAEEDAGSAEGALVDAEGGDAFDPMDFSDDDADALVADIFGEGGIGASKIRRALTLVTEFVGANPRGKLIIFSMFASVLHLLQLAFARSAAHRNLLVCRIDGTVRNEDERRAILHHFRLFDQAPAVLLLGGKVGGEGLTIIEATAGILMEPHWSPADSMQQRRRFWRIGQVHVTWWWTLRARDTIEEFVLHLNEHKEALEHQIRHGGRLPAGAAGGAMDKKTLGVFLAERAQRIALRGAAAGRAEEASSSAPLEISVSD